jgi:hypothetical protein
MPWRAGVLLGAVWIALLRPGADAQQGAGFTPDSLSLARARGAATDLGADLMRMLMAALDSSGPAAALAYCADSAQARTARHQAAGLHVHRIGTRLRNPANRPDSLEQRLLAALKDAKDRKQMPGEVIETWTDAQGRRMLQYLRPILVAPRCVACHGAREEIDAEVRAVLAARYPEDAAVGYRAGDLRGAVSVRMALPSTP